jgi:isoleucyl-tRNA synthetase
VFIEQWYQGWPEVGSVKMNDWLQFQAIRDEVNKALESQRQTGTIGSALAAEVILYANDNVQSMLARLGNELHFILITSSATVRPMSERTEDAVLNEALGVAIGVKASQSPKCSRCWHRCEDVGIHIEHPELCGRCIGNISGKPEVRHFA